jgi:hypothetical protein
VKITMDGYQDLDALMSELHTYEGMGAEYAKPLIASALRVLLEALTATTPFGVQAEFHAVCSGIVQAAEEEGLI